jgi:hypothetical protein
VSGGKASICSVLKAEHKIVSVAVVLAAVERDAPILAVCATLPDEGKYLTGNTALLQEGIAGNG